MSARRTIRRTLLTTGLLAAFGLGATVSPKRAARGHTEPTRPPSAEAAARPDPTARLESLRAEVRKLAGALLAQLDELEDLRGRLADQEFTSKRANAEAIKAQRDRENAEIALGKYQARDAAEEVEEARREVKHLEGEMDLLGPQHKWWKDMVKFGYRAPLQLKEFESLALEPTRQALADAKERLKFAETEGRAHRLAEFRRQAEEAATLERYWKWAWDLEEKREAKLRRQVEDKALSDRQRQILARLDQAVAAVEEGSIRQVAASDGPIATAAMADRAESRLAEALRMAAEEEAERTARRDAEIRRRLRELSDEAARRPSAPKVAAK